MIHPPENAGAQPGPRAGALAWFSFLGLCLLLAGIAISNQSFWMDEAATSSKALQPTLERWWSEMVAQRGSDLQMPVYMVYAWAWEKVFGHGEWWMRLSNLPWLAVGLLAIPRRRFLFALLVAVSPFVWFYLDEARPYVMQFSSALLIIGSLSRLVERNLGTATSRRDLPWTASFCLGLVALAGSSLLGMIWTGIALVCTAALLGFRSFLDILRRHWLLVASTLVAFVLLAVFYLWTLRQGVRATPGSTSARNAIFALYEMLGFAGLGPGRLRIRTGGFGAFIPYAAPLCICGVLMVYAMFHSWLSLWGSRLRGSILAAGAILSLGAAVLFLLGVAKHFSILARHFTPLVPCLLLFLSCGLGALSKAGGCRRAIPVVFIGFSLISALSLRFSERHAKDDYRGAAVIVRDALTKGQAVWWCADGGAGLYYGVPLSDRNRPPASGQVMLLKSPPSSLVAGQPAADVVVLSKPDLHDAQGSVQTYLTENRYAASRSLAAFTVWSRTEVR